MAKNTVILSICGRKGGITKTTVATNLAAALALEGLNVLLIESDGQGNASQAMGLEPQDDFFELVLGDAEFIDVIRPVPVEFAGKPVDLDLLSASNMQRKVEESKATPQQMYERFQELRGVYDVVIGDTSPGLTEVHTGWYYASDYVLLPTTCETHSINSIADSLAFLKQADEAGAGQYPAAKVLGILPNRYNKGVNNSQFNLGLLYGLYKDYHIYERLRDLIAWETASRASRSIYSLTAGNDRRLSMSIKDARKEFGRVVESVYALTKAVRA